MKKDLGIIFGLFFIIVLLLIFGRGYVSTSFVSTNNSTSSASLKNLVKLQIKNLILDVKVSESQNERKTGLSKLDSMPLNEGMLFVFDKEDKWRIWMKDMKFAIDIVWINKDKKIVSLNKNVPVEKGKKDRDLQIYEPETPSMYILEINAGLIDLNGLQIGDNVDFSL